jgi:hypothetical protein
MNKIPNADYLDADWQSEITSKNLLKKGYSSITFKNINDTSVESPIESGSVIEINGVFYEFDADTTPSGTLQDGINYVRVIGGSSPDVEYTTDPLPKYDEKRKGYYDASDRRYIMKIDKSESFDTIYYNNVKELAYGDDMVIGRITESGAPTFPYKIIKSTDGITWTTTFSSDGSHSVLGLYHDGSKFCMFYDYEMHTSLDGEHFNLYDADGNKIYDPWPEDVENELKQKLLYYIRSK